jgi:hypothetical protein
MTQDARLLNDTAVVTVSWPLRVAQPPLMRVTGRVLPVFEYQGWQVETVEVGLGTGLRELIEIRHGDDCWQVATLAERDALLRQSGIDPLELTEMATAEDGCE